MIECGFDSKQVHQRTISRYLNRNGFYLRQTRKKGLQNKKDKHSIICSQEQPSKGSNSTQITSVEENMIEMI